MKECGVSEGTVIGEACRRLPETGQGPCYLGLLVRDEDGSTVGYLRSLVGRAFRCPFQKDVLECIREKESDPRDKETGFLNTIGNILKIPQTMREFVRELDRLNYNLAELREVLVDLRAMAALALGWKVVDKEKEV